MMPAPPTGAAPAARAAVAAHPLWYHTLELGPGIVTPGWFDLRPVLPRLPWPEVEGKRCLDVGPYDGALAFELERRGAREVVAVDIGSHADWDWPYRERRRGPELLAGEAGGEVGRGFRIARDALGSGVERVELSVYELSPERIGSFDVITCGSLLLHLRDPVRALEAIRSVCRGWLLSAETISLGLTVLSRRRPLGRLLGGEDCQWTIPNAAGHRQWVGVAGFELERWTRPYAVPFGTGHRPDLGLRSLPSRILARALAGGVGVPHAAVLARALAGPG